MWRVVQGRSYHGACLSQPAPSHSLWRASRLHIRTGNRIEQGTQTLPPDSLTSTFARSADVPTPPRRFGGPMPPSVKCSSRCSERPDRDPVCLRAGSSHRIDSLRHLHQDPFARHLGASVRPGPLCGSRWCLPTSDGALPTRPGGQTRSQLPTRCTGGFRRQPS